jgi:hypothetical protein
VKDLGGVRRDGAGAQPADVGEMRPGHHQRDPPTFVEGRRQQHLVIGMRDGAVGAVAVVVPVHVARPHALGREVAEHRTADIAEDGHVRADAHHPIGVEQRSVEILLLADEGRHGGALDQRLHLRLAGADGTPDDLEGDGIAASVHAVSGGGNGARG